MLSCSVVSATPWTVTFEAPLSVGFPRQEDWSGLPFPGPGALPDPGIVHLLRQQEDSLPLCHLGWIEISVGFGFWFCSLVCFYNMEGITEIPNPCHHSLHLPGTPSPFSVNHPNRPLSSLLWWPTMFEDLPSWSPAPLLPLLPESYSFLLSCFLLPGLCPLLLLSVKTCE